MDGKRQNIFSIIRDFVLLSGPREPDWGAGVDKIRSFCSVFVYFEVRAGAFLESAVDKNE